MVVSDPRHTECSNLTEERKLYAIMKTMCPPGYHHNGFVATHALEHMMYGSCAQVHELPQSHCGDNREGTFFSWFHCFIYHFVALCWLGT